MSASAAIRSTVLHMLPTVFDQTDAASALVYERAGLDPRQPCENRPVIARAQALAALTAAGRFFGDDTFSLTCGVAAQPKRFGLIGHALLSGLTVRQCIENYGRAMPSFQSGATIALKIAHGEAQLSHQLSGDPDKAGFLNEAIAVFLVQALRALIGARWSPTVVEFSHGPPSRIDRFEDFFCAPVRFRVGRSGVIAFPAIDLDAPVRRQRRDSDVDWTVLGDQKREIDAYQMSDDLLVEALEHIIDAMMMSERVSLPMAAETLGVSVRQTQRRLSRLRMNFEEMTERRRSTRATELLRDPGLRVAEVALALGYSDSAHFIRAFNKWHGEPPARYRAALNA